MKNYRTHCGHCKNYVYMGDYVTCGRPDGCVLNGTHTAEEIPLDFDRTTNAAPDNTMEVAAAAFLPEMVNVVSGPDVNPGPYPWEKAPRPWAEDTITVIPDCPGCGETFCGPGSIIPVPKGMTPAEVAKAATAIQIGGDHYASQAIQPIDYIFENNLGFCEGNVIKYVTRYKKKNGVEDLKKARHYLDMLIERLEAK